MSKKRLHNDVLGTSWDEISDTVKKELMDSWLLMGLDEVSDSEVFFENNIDINNKTHELQIEKKAEKLIKIGISHFKTEDYIKAAAHFLAASTLIPGSIKAWNNLGVSWFYLGRLDEAENAFKKVLELAPENEIALKNLALISKKKHFKEG